MESGMIFNIQRFSLHDGPGIRTVVFFKGCPLKCRWCHNPEGIESGQELMYHHKKCLACGSCAKICPNNAIAVTESIITINREKCRLCLKCRDECPVEAMDVIGRRMTVAQVMADALKDRVFYEESGGGVTFSGGEPLMQPDFLISLLKACKQANIHTAVETSGHTPWSVLELASGWTDLFLFDLKLIDSQKSRDVTGVSNEIILENLRKLAQIHRNIIIRIPIIPTVNDDIESIRLFAEHLLGLGLKHVSILPYHQTGEDKYVKTGRNYALPEVFPPDSEKMNEIRRSLEKYGLNIMD